MISRLTSTMPRYPGVCALLLCLMPAVVWAEPAPRLPVEAFFADRSFSHPRLSPNGEHIAMLYSDGERQMVVVRPTLGGRAGSIGVISDPEVRLAWLEWANDDRILFSVESRNHLSVGVRGRQHRLVGIDRSGQNMKFLGEDWPRRVQFEDRILHWLPDRPNHVLIQYRDSSSPLPMVKRLDVRTGQLQPIQKREDDVHSWIADHDGHIRAGSGVDGLSVLHFARADHKKRWHRIEKYNPYERDGMEPAGFSYQSPDILYVMKDVDGRRGIFEYDLVARKLGKKIFSHETYDASGLVFDHERRVLVGVSYITDRPRIHFLDDQARREQEGIDKALPGAHNRVVSRSRDGNRAIVLSSGDVWAPEYYLFTRDTEPKRLEVLLAPYPELKNEYLAPMKTVIYQARDGLHIHGYLTVPKGLEAKNLPVVVFPHGGPSSRDVHGFNLEVQWLANQGFAVFQMNFRGSTGYGSRHLKLGYREWGQAMQDDITDGVRWLIAESIADPQRIGIYGSSYGGYAALMGLVKTPELFRAGASYAGISDLPKLLSDGEWYLFNDHNKPQIGGGWGDKDRLKAASAYHNVDRIRAPVLLAHGEDDPAVHIRQSERMARALKKAGKEVELLRFEHEAHGFLLQANRIRFYDALASFFRRHLAKPAGSKPASSKPASSKPSGTKSSRSGS